MRIITALILTTLLFPLSGCGSPARLESMVASPITREQQKISESMGPFFILGAVTGGTDTSFFGTTEIDNITLRKAMEQSLRGHWLYAYDSADAMYRIDATLQSLNKPMLIELDHTVEATIHYRVSEIDSTNVIMDEAITASYTVPVEEAMVNSERLRQASEGAMRENLHQFIATLYQRLGQY